jgi:oligopeptide transport system permease protein
MLRYAIIRLLGAIPTLFVIVLMSFFMMRLAPGGPFDRERLLPPEIEAVLLKAYHLDEPLWMQFGRYLGGLVQGDLGPSFQYKDFTVSELIGNALPVSLTIGGIAIVLAAIVGIILGTIAALRQNSWIDYSVMGVSMTGIAMPSFVMAPVLTLVFGLTLKLLPVGGWVAGDPRYIILPVIALTLPHIAYIARLTRGNMIEVMRASHVRTARAKGISEAMVVWRHALRGGLLPVISYLGPATAGILTGSVVVEQIFGIPGVGRFFVQAALNRDYTLVLGVIVVYGVLIVLFNLAVDLAYGLLDPRVRYDG